MTTCPATIYVQGHRLALTHVGNTLGVTLTLRATKACGHLEPEGRDGGEHARKLRDAIAKATLELARKLGAVQVEIYATTSTNTWLASVEHVIEDRS